MTSHAAPARIGWIRWHCLCVEARIFRIIIKVRSRWQQWHDARVARVHNRRADRHNRREARRAADGAPFWGDTGTTGDYTACRDYSDSCDWCQALPGQRHGAYCPNDEPEPQVIDHDAASASVHYWAQVAHDAIAANSDVPGRGSPPARPGTRNVAVPAAEGRVQTATVPPPTTLAARTQPEAAAPGLGIPPPPAPDEQLLAMLTRAFGGHHSAESCVGALFDHAAEKAATWYAGQATS